MAFRLTAWTAVRETNYAMFTKDFRRVVTKHGGHMERVAQDIGVHISTIKRWVKADAALSQFVTRVRQQRRGSARGKLGRLHNSSS